MSPRAGPRRPRVRGSSRFDLYELCVQNPANTVRLLQAIQGGNGRRPRVLREDFCGSAAVSREWVRAVKHGRAVAVDLDPQPLRIARGVRGLRAVVRDAISTPNPRGQLADVIYVGNFSIGEVHKRADLVRYLRRCRQRLAPGGVFVCDIYGGKSAFRTGSVHRVHALPGKQSMRVRYTWQQREAEPRTRMVTNSIHFRIERHGKALQEIENAFVYHWRLWSIAQLRRAMREAGFASTAIYGQSPDAIDEEGRAYAHALRPRDLNDDYIVHLAATKR